MDMRRLNSLRRPVAPLLMSMDELPLAILCNILSRVSIEWLPRYRRVCKHWREVIDDSCLRNTLHHLKGPVVLCMARQEKIHLLRIHEATSQLIGISKFPGLKDYVFLGACNGLFFYRHRGDVKNNPELLINPLTKEILRLPRAPDLQPKMSVYGFGFDRSTNTYKMVQIENARNFMRTQIYDFKKQSWRTCKSPPSSDSASPFIKFVFASGALFWKLINYSSSDGLFPRAMLSFDLTKEEFSLIPIPDVFLGCRHFNLRTRVHVLEGSLALVHCSNTRHNDVWLLRDYPRREWIRKYRIQPPCNGDVGNYSVLGPYERNKLILHHRGHMYLYDVNKHSFTRCWNEAGCCEDWQCETLSLVSLNRDLILQGVVNQP